MEAIFLFICVAAVGITAIICVYNYRGKLADLKAKSEENSYKKDILEIRSIIKSMRCSCVKQTEESLQDIINNIADIVD